MLSGWLAQQCVYKGRIALYLIIDVSCWLLAVRLRAILVRLVMQKFAIPKRKIEVSHVLDEYKTLV